MVSWHQERYDGSTVHVLWGSNRGNPLHHMRFPANLDFYALEKKYISKIYSAKDELLMELEMSPTAHRSL